MMNDHEVMIFLQTDEEVEIETQVIDLQSKHISMSFLDGKTFDYKVQKYIKWRIQSVYLFS